MRALYKNADDAYTRATCCFVWVSRAGKGFFLSLQQYYAIANRGLLLWKIYNHHRETKKRALISTKSINDNNDALPRFY
jgi:hypothetical protein